jgi:hypothetical protein
MSGIDKVFTDSADGINIINQINTQGLRYSLGIRKNPTRDDLLQIDGRRDKDPVCITEEKNIVYWRIFSRRGKFAKTGKDNYTARLHIIPKESNGEPITGISRARSQGYLVSPRDFKNIEFTVIAKVNDIKDDSKAYSMKIRGGPHDGRKESTLCCEGIYPYKKMKQNLKLYSVEATHPHYRFESVNIVPASKSNLKFPGNNWIGLKQICYNLSDFKLRMEMWIDYNPIDFVTGKPKNNWFKVWDIEDCNIDTPVWGGKYTTLRVDQCDSVDIYAMNCYEIRPPSIPV